MSITKQPGLSEEDQAAIHAKVSLVCQCIAQQWAFAMEYPPGREAQLAMDSAVILSEMAGLISDYAIGGAPPDWPPRVLGLAEIGGDDDGQH